MPLQDTLQEGAIALHKVSTLQRPTRICLCIAMKLSAGAAAMCHPQFLFVVQVCM